MMNCNEFFRKNVTYDDIKSHPKSGLQPLSRKHSFGKTTDGIKLTTTGLLRVKKSSRCCFFH